MFIFFFLVVFVVGLFLALSLISGLFYWWARSRKKPALKSTLGWVSASCAIIACLILAGSWLFVSMPTKRDDPAGAFQDVFGGPPPATVRLKHGESGAFFDAAGLSLQFETDRATFDLLRLAEQKRWSGRWTEMSREEFVRYPLEKPSWWRTPTDSTEIWHRETGSDEAMLGISNTHGFLSERTFLTWDADGLVQYDWSGID